MGDNGDKVSIRNEEMGFAVAEVNILFLIRMGGGVHIGCPRGTATMYWPIVPVPGDCEDGEVGGMK
jgi:hypothetical protein